MPIDHAGLISGVTIGSKQGISEGFWEKLKNSGTVHVVVASGMNVTLVASFLINFLILFLPRKRAVFAAISGIWIYSLLSGFDAPIVRAAIMGSLAFGAVALGRLYVAWRALFISAAAMLIIKPDWVTDLGFILSVVATASLMLFERKIYRMMHFVPGIFREGLSTSFAAQIGVAPIIYATFGQFNILSPIANALVLWTIPLMTTIGMVSGLVGVITPSFGRIFLYLTYPLTSWFIFVVELFG